ncbi:MAG: VWA domain-containing protein [Deltaproteobacteria bacterium]|nr:MAG: VWA domain-containing protein [Deltaproteobacteria bacterium]TMB21106.1 MAG: VWA domain-containing protein [Deltaproteobacteria bacterium]
MFVPFLYELRDRGVKVGAQEALSLAQALGLELHRGTLDGFYEVARALCVHREQDLDAFDRAFAHHFRGVPDDALALTDELLQWLEQPAAKRQLTELERQLLERIDLAEARDRLRRRLAEQRERHDRGNRWVGTAGSSPHGTSGIHPTGIKVGEAPGGRGALEVAAERRFRDFRSDVTLDTRHIEVALRRLRAFVREGALDELDVGATIDKTARNGGELEITMRPPRRSNLRVLLLLDVGGSMDPHAHVCERLFSAASRATHFKELRTHYFHNCVYGRVYESAALMRGVPVLQLLQDCDPSWRLIVVGDALMSPWELQSSGSRWSFGDDSGAPGIAWLAHLAQHFLHSAWLNPEPAVAWYGTAGVIRRVFPMYRLTQDGLLEAVQHLMRGGGRH